MSAFPSGRLMLYLTELTEPHDNALRIVVVEAKAEGATKSIPGVVTAVTPIVISPSSRHFLLEWDSYVAYSVRNESFAQFDKERPGGSDTLTERTTSAFLRYAREPLSPRQITPSRFGTGN
jgi:hypothetical protein